LPVHNVLKIYFITQSILQHEYVTITIRTYEARTPDQLLLFVWNPNSWYWRRDVMIKSDYKIIVKLCIFLHRLNSYLSVIKTEYIIYLYIFFSIKLDCSYWNTTRRCLSSHYFKYNLKNTDPTNCNQHVFCMYQSAEFQPNTESH
jgi:hypothetical protein